MVFRINKKRSLVSSFSTHLDHVVESQVSVAVAFVEIDGRETVGIDDHVVLERVVAKILVGTRVTTRVPHALAE